MADDMINEEGELINDFIAEAFDHLETIETRAVALEKDGLHDEDINAMFRSFHTIKGNAKWLGLEKIVRVSHEAESMLGDIKNKKLPLSPSIVDAILNSRDIVYKLIEQIKSGDSTDIDISDIISQIARERAKKNG